MNTNKKYIHDCMYFVILKTKRKVFKNGNEEIKEQIIKALEEVSKKYDFEVQRKSFGEDYLFLTIRCCNPAFGIDNVIKKIKSYTVRNLSKEQKKKLPSFWTRQVYVQTIGEINVHSLNDILNYFERGKQK